MAKLKVYLSCAIFLLYINTSVQAQLIAPFAIIQDKDGYVNVRDSDSKNAKIIDRLIENQIFEDQRQFGNGNEEWIYISYKNKQAGKGSIYRTDKEKTGYIHKSRILYLDKLPQLKRKIITQDHSEFENDTLKLTVKTGKFIPEEHQIEKKEGFVFKIDNNEPWGIDGILPESLEEIKSVTITYKEQTYSFPAEALSGLFSPNIDNMRVYLGSGNTLFTVMSNGDAAGAYNVVWTIQNNKVTDRFINRDF